MVLPSAALVQVANDDINLHASATDSANIMNLKHSVEFSMSKVDLARPVSKLTVSKTYKSSTAIKFPKCPGQCHYILGKSMLVLRPKRSTVVDDKCKLPQKIDFAKPVLTPIVVALNAGEAALPYHQDLTESVTNGAIISSLHHILVPDEASYWCSNQGAASQESRFILDTCGLSLPLNLETPRSSVIIGPTVSANASEDLEKGGSNA
ncbi:hypothetical protein ACTXT7_005118 [Hymenolepis weldensis]